MRRRAVAIIGVVTGALLSPAMTGAVAPLFWQYSPHGTTAPIIARRLYERTDLDRATEVLDADQRWPGPCEGRIGVDDEGSRNLGNALQRLRFVLARQVFDYPGEEALLRLPLPALGALDKCIGGSPLSALCLTYARSTAAEATLMPTSRVNAERDVIEGRVELAACAAYRAGPKP